MLRSNTFSFLRLFKFNIRIKGKPSHTISKKYYAERGDHHAERQNLVVGPGWKNKGLIKCVRNVLWNKIYGKIITIIGTKYPEFSYFRKYQG
jgi:hypothetical protein